MVWILHISKIVKDLNEKNDQIVLHHLSIEQLKNLLKVSFNATSKDLDFTEKTFRISLAKVFTDVASDESFTLNIYAQNEGS